MCSPTKVPRHRGGGHHGRLRWRPPRQGEARAKERIYSHRDDFGQWNPKKQRPELWSLCNGKIHSGEHMRIFPLPNRTELDI
jgi:3'-phosphoadenosine 5'-phosphosulfate sulfotransferase (PAPS reductase)/FAD synthetase